jgi:AcrR family transcriptional regulator
MNKNVDSETTKKNIINATLELMNELGDINKLSIRKIVKRAGIKGVGLINYHFGTKENLINEAVRSDTNAIIDQWDAIYEKMDQNPIQKLKIMMRGTSDLLDTNPLFGRISIIHDILNPKKDDNTMRSLKKYMMIFREIYGDTKTDQEIKIIAHVMLSAGQLAFLRADVLINYTNLDFFSKEQRYEFLDIMIDSLIGKDVGDTNGKK